MSRDWIGPTLAALVAVAALSMASATFDSARPDRGVTLGGGEPDRIPSAASGGERGDSSPDDGGPGVSPLLLPGDDPAASDATDGASERRLPLPVVAAAVALLAVVSALVYRLTGDDDRATRDDEEEQTNDARPPAWPADPSLPNDVYRAWYAMARRSSVPDGTTATPGDVATAAVDDGQPADAVATLTHEFRRARYADTPMTAGTETRSRAALERLRPDEEADR